MASKCRRFLIIRNLFSGLILCSLVLVVDPGVSHAGDKRAETDGQRDGDRKDAAHPGEPPARSDHPDAGAPMGHRVVQAERMDFFERCAELEGLLGDWAGGRDWLAERGVTFSLGITAIYQQNARGGLQTHRGHRITGSVDTELQLDLEEMGLRDLGYIYLLAETGWADGIGGDRVGNLFGVNGDALGDYSIAVSELWYEHEFLDGRLRTRLGKIDLTTDFDTNAYANDERFQFINPALVNTANMPAPAYALGGFVIAQPADWLYAGLVAVDAQAGPRETGFSTAFHDEDYFFSALEIGLAPTWQSARGPLPGTYRIGVWYAPQPRELFHDGSPDRAVPAEWKRDDIGLVINIDQLVYKERAEADEDTQGLGVFMRYGYASEEANAIEHFWSAGAQYQGLIPTRDDDVLGFGFAQGIVSGRLSRLTDQDRESVYELYYNLRLLPWLEITPDVQDVADPGGSESGDDATVIGLRVQMYF